MRLKLVAATLLVCACATTEDKPTGPIVDMDKLPEYAKQAEKEQDKSTAGTLMTWHQIWKDGLKDESLSKSAPAH